MRTNYITTARSYQKLLNEAVQGKKDVEMIMQLLSSLKLDENYILTLRYIDSHSVGIGDNNWLYCYKNDSEKEYQRKEDFNHDLWPPDFINQSYEIFYHLSVEKSKRGVWQAYLMSIAAKLLPAYWHGLYESRKNIFSQKDVENLTLICRGLPIPDPNGIKIESDLSPNIWINGNDAYVSCCYWNDWKGVIRETIAFRFEGNRIVSGKRLPDQVLYKYINPIDL